MADQNIHFKHAGDTGQRDDSNAIEPVIDGQPAQQSTFRRPPENLRYRTELLRTAGEDSKYLHDTDKGWRIVNANTLGENPGNPLPSVIWDPDGYAPGEGSFVVSADIAVQPMDTPAVDSKETKSYEFPVAGPTAGTVDFTAELFSYEGMDYRRIVWLEVPFADIPNDYCLIEVTGGGTDLNIVTITVRNDGLTSIADVDAEITVQAANLLLAGFTAGITGVGSTKVDTLPVDDDYTMARTWERQLHHILPGDFASFFGSHGLADGDTLAIFYEWLVEVGGKGGRRQSTPTSSATPPNTAAGTRLFITSEEPWKIPLSIPLCKRSGDDLLFIDGTVITSPQAGTVHFGEHGYTLNSMIDAVATIGTPWADGTYLNGVGAPPYEYAIEDALNYILGDLAATTSGDSGAQKIGLQLFLAGPNPSTDPMVWVGGELKDFLNTLFNYVNRKGSLGSDENITGVWKFQDNYRVDDDTIQFRDADPALRPIYYNHEPPAAVAQDTFSVWESEFARYYCWGGYPSATDQITSGTTTGPDVDVTFLILGKDDGATPKFYWALGHRGNAGAGTVLDINDPTDWHSLIYYDAVEGRVITKAWGLTGGNFKLYDEDSYFEGKDSNAGHAVWTPLFKSISTNDVSFPPVSVWYGGKEDQQILFGFNIYWDPTAFPITGNGGWRAFDTGTTHDSWAISLDKNGLTQWFKSRDGDNGGAWEHDIGGPEPTHWTAKRSSGTTLGGFNRLLGRDGYEASSSWLVNDLLVYMHARNFRAVPLEALRFIEAGNHTNYSIRMNTPPGSFSNITTPTEVNWTSSLSASDHFAITDWSEWGITYTGKTAAQLPVDTTAYYRCIIRIT